MVGYSDHSEGVGIPLSSINYGACVIEKHFTLKKNDKTLDSSFSLDINYLDILVKEIKKIWQAKGTAEGKSFQDEKIYKNFRRSIYAVKNINKNERFSQSNIKIIRPGFGLQPIYLNKIIGKKSKKRLTAGSAIKFSHF